MAFSTPPARSVPTTNIVTVTTDAQLDAEIAARIADGASRNVLIDGAFREIYVNGYSCTDGGDGLQLWLLDGSSVTFDGTNPGGGTAIVRLRDCDFIGMQAATGITRPVIDGASTGGNGAIWGFVIGQSFFGDSRSGPCTNVTVAGIEVKDVQQETFKISASGTGNVVVIDNDIHGAGQDPDTAKRDLAELVYCGEGNDTVLIDDVLIRWNVIHDNDATDMGGEGVDVKRGSQNVKIWDNDIYNLTMRFAGAITFWSDDIDPGVDANGSILRNRVWNAKPAAGAFTQSIEAIEIGGDCTIERNIMWDFSGRGINVTEQFAGSNKIVNAHYNTIDATAGDEVFGLNVEAPNGGGPNPGALIASNNAYRGTLSDGTNGAGGSLTNNISAAVADFVGPITGTAFADGADGRGFFPVSGGALDGASNDFIASVDLDIDLVALPQGASREVGAAELFTAVSPVANDDGPLAWTVGTAESFNATLNDVVNGGSGVTVPLSGLPAGVTMDAAGVISGTPTTAGSYSVLYRLENSAGLQDTATVTINVSAATTTASSQRCYFLG